MSTTLDTIIETLINVLNNVEDLPSIDHDKDFGIPDNAMEMDVRRWRAFYDYQGDDYDHGDIYAYQATSVTSTIRVLYVVHYDLRGNKTRREFQTSFPSLIRRAVENETSPTSGAFPITAKCRMECTGVRIDNRSDVKFGVLAVFKATEYTLA